MAKTYFLVLTKKTHKTLSNQGSLSSPYDTTHLKYPYSIIFRATMYVGKISKNDHILLQRAVSYGEWADF